MKTIDLTQLQTMIQTKIQNESQKTRNLFSTWTYLLLSVLVGTTACTKKSQDFLQLSGEEIFSNRPQNQTHFIALIKLNTPALLTTAKIEDGVSSVDKDQLKILNEEQDAALKAIEGISKDIKVIYKYKMVLNGMALLVPVAALEKLRLLVNVSYIENEGTFARPSSIVKLEALEANKLNLDKTSVNHIGADKVHLLKKKNKAGQEVAIDGQGTTVGIIDTGIDYTHSMLMGAGTTEAFKNIKPSEASEFFPNKKVVGGVDLVGTDYNAASALPAAKLPKPDVNPLDEAGHGTHVAGTVAGLGDGQMTYSGVAPGALLHAIKVFGKDGSTGDAAVIAGLEYAADPNSDGAALDRLDVVNLSLGSSYGNPHILYGEAIRNLSQGGTVVVASAGNSGDQDYIVGSPSIADEAISVAASIDHSEHNWRFNAVKVLFKDQKVVLAEAVEASFTKQIKDIQQVEGQFVVVGLANKDFDDAQKQALKGKIALIDRGVVTFKEKIERVANAGAIGAVIANNQAGAAFRMGGDGSVNIPAIMMTQVLGDQIKDAIAKTEVVSMQFKTSEQFEKPELIDTLTGFSSKGPRSIDSFLKPDISAPGESIISAAMGEGTKGVAMSGTSMAAPHLAGVMALLRQLHPAMTVNELKSLAMGQAVKIHDENKKAYLVTRQGAGRVNVLSSAEAKVLSSPASISLGEQNIRAKKQINFKVNLKNISQDKLNLTAELVQAKDGLTMLPVEAVTVAGAESKVILMKFVLDTAKMKAQVAEYDGFVNLKDGDKVVLSIPVLAVTKQISEVKALALNVNSSESDSAGAAVSLDLVNKGAFDGQALIFNLLGHDQRKKDKNNDQFRSRGCDLQSVGYRIIESSADEQKKKVLQVAAKIYEPLTTWQSCELSVLIDTNGDQQADQEIAGTVLGSLAGLAAPNNAGMFVSLLLDAKLAREVRKKFEEDLMKKPDATEDYSSAVIDLRPMMVVDHSTVMIIEADVTKLMRKETGELSIKVASIHNESSSVEMDDFLDKTKAGWRAISLNENNQSFLGMPEQVVLKAGEKVTLDFEKGTGKHDLLVLFPQNANLFSNVQKDTQAQTLKPKFLF